MFDPATSTRLKALAHTERLRLLALLGEVDRFPDNLVDPLEVGVCVNDLARAAGLPQSTASRHLAILAKGGLVEVTPHGPWRYARRNLAAFADLASAFEAASFSPRPH